MSLGICNKKRNHQLIFHQSFVSKLTQNNRKSVVIHFFAFYRIYSTQEILNINDMIEVIAEILRGPVFLAGETLHCQITFTNKLTNENNSTNHK
jgi:hypothetical protein